MGFVLGRLWWAVSAIILVLWSLLLFIVRVWSLTGVKLLGQGGLEKAQA